METKLRKTNHLSSILIKILDIFRFIHTKSGRNF